MNSKKIKVIIFLLVLITFLFSHSIKIYAIDISPMKANLNNVRFDKDYTFFLTLINNENIEKGLEMKLEFNSEYLSKYTTFEPRFFKINPQQSKNVKITLKLDETIPIGEHVLQVQPIADSNELVNKFTLDFLIPGAQEHILEINRFSTLGSSIKEPIYLNLTIENLGNTVEKISPKLLVRLDGNVVDIREYNTQYTLLPNTKENIILMYDPTKLNEGKYSLDIEIPYADKTISQTKEITLNNDESDPLINSSNIRTTNYSTGLISLFTILLISSIIYFIVPKAMFIIKKKKLEKKIHYLTIKNKHLESEFKQLTGDLIDFVENSNKFLGRFGEKYEFN